MLTEPLENLLNRNLSRSPAAREGCVGLQGRRLGIQLLGIDQHFVLESLGTSLKLSRETGLDLSVEVAGTPVNLLLMLASDPQSDTARRLLATGAITIKGDAGVLQRFRQLLSLLQPDLPAELEIVLGDNTFGRTVAHQLSQVFESVVGFGKQAGRTATLNLAEYLAHETGDLVPRAEAEQFLSDVDALRERADRLQARWSQLEQRSNPTEGAAT